MRRRVLISCLFIVFMFLLIGPVLAEGNGVNEAHIGQRGNNLNAEIKQKGHNNQAGINQWGSVDFLPLQNASTSISGSIKQTGDSNVGLIYQGAWIIGDIGVQNTSGYLRQHRFLPKVNVPTKNNLAEIKQNGDNNLAAIGQIGIQGFGVFHKNYAYINQSGNNNVGFIGQLGSGNLSEINQYGSDNQAVIQQFGIGNEASIIQIGDNNRAKVIQN